jgi:hypothetical protein
MPVVVRGESYVRWELRLLDEDGNEYDDTEVRVKAIEYVRDMLDLQGAGETKAMIEGQDDRVLTVRPAAWSGVD